MNELAALWSLGMMLASPPVEAEPTTICGVATAPATDQEFEFGDVVRAIDDAHPRIAAAAARVDAAAANAVIAGLWTNPQLSAQWDRSAGFTTYSPRLGYLQLQATQWIEVGAPRARRRAGRWEAEATRQDRADVRRGLVRDAYAAVVALALAQHRLDIVAEARVQLGQAERIVERRVEAGAAPNVHLLRLEILAAELDAAEQVGVADLVRARRDLDVAVGPAAARLPGRARFDLCERPALPDADVLHRASNQRPDLVALRTREKGADATVDAARRSVFRGIGVTVGAAFGGGYDTTSGQSQIDVVGGVALPLPLVDRGPDRIRASKALASAARRDADAAEARAERDVSHLHDEALARRAARVRLADAGVKRAQTLVVEVLAGYRDGAMSVLEVVDALETLRQLRLELGDLAAAARMTEGELLDAAGTLGAP